MFSNLLYFSPILPAIILAIEDFKYRQIHLMWIVLFAILIIIKEIYLNNTTEILENLLMNSMVVLLMLLSIFIWLFIRKGAITNPFKEYFGLGDLFFICSVAPTFPLEKFTLYLLISFIVAIFFQFLKKHNEDLNNNKVPLVTFLASIYVINTLLRLN